MAKKSTTLDGKNSRGESAINLAKDIIKSNKSTKATTSKAKPAKKGK